MKTKLFLQQLLLLILAWYVQPDMLAAQEALPESPWTVGANVGINLSLDCPNCYDNESTSASAAALHIDYRVLRWLGLSLNTGYYHQSSFYNRLLSAGNNNVIPTLNNVDVYIGSLSLGPQLLLRVEQGDIGLAYRYGVSVRKAYSESNTYEGQNYKIAYQSKWDAFSAWELSYTYWPTHHFGITAGVETSSISEGQLSGIGVPYTPLRPLEELYPEASIQLLEGLPPLARGPNFFNFNLGFIYRF